MPDLTITEFVERIDEVMPAVIRGFTRRQANELSKGKITLPQFFILSGLEKNGVSKMSEVAHLMEVTTAAATGIIDRLVRCGYVAREYDPEDRRIINVRLTQKGIDVVKKISRQRRQVTLDVFGRISKEQREGYLSTLLRIRDILSYEK